MNEIDAYMLPTELQRLTVTADEWIIESNGWKGCSIPLRKMTAEDRIKVKQAHNFNTLLVIEVAGETASFLVFNDRDPNSAEPAVLFLQQKIPE